MGKKGGWFSAIKRVFTPNSKDKPVNDSGKKDTKEKKKKKPRHGETNSFIPLFRKPSSIEKIFGDFEREQQRHNLRPEEESTQTPKQSSFAGNSPRVVSPPRVASPRAPSSPTPRVVTPRAPSPPPRPRSPRLVVPNNPHKAEPSLSERHASATRIQAAYRGFTGRRSFRALKGLVRLQGVVRGQSVKRQTANAMKYMQLVVRVQSQIQSRRIQMLETQSARHHQAANLGTVSEAGNGDWDDSVLTKEQADARMNRKVEAIVKRERAMAYAYSNQLWKSSETPPQQGDRGGFPWWYNWLDRQLPNARPATPPNPITDTPTPKSSKSTTSRLARTPLSKHLRPPRYGGANFEFPTHDDQSLTSCPPFSVPNYMVPTVSAKAKSRANSNPKERFMGTPTSTASTVDSKRRLSFPLWRNNNSNNNNVDSRRTPSKPPSLSNFSVDSTASMPAALPFGRKPFNRFV